MRKDLTRNLLALYSLPGIGVKKMAKYYGPLILADDFAELVSGEYSAVDIDNARIKADDILAQCTKYGIGVIPFYDDRYPQLLKDTVDKPPVLYYKGDVTVLENTTPVAIIGTRQPSSYSVACARRCGRIFSSHAYSVVSGLAIGCDTEVHKAVIESSGLAVAVLANGLDTVAPASNKLLALNILEKGGLLLSERPPESKIMKSDFVARDRIQAGISRGVLLIQSSANGGSMYAVKRAIGLNRPVGVIDPVAAKFQDGDFSGNQNLIDSGSVIAIRDSSSIETFKSRIRSGEDHSSEQFLLNFG